MNLSPRTLRFADYLRALKSAHQLWLHHPAVFAILFVILFLSFLIGAIESRWLAVFPIWLGVLIYVGLSLCYRVDMHLPTTISHIAVDLREAQRPMAWTMVTAAVILAIYVPFGWEIAMNTGAGALIGIEPSAPRQSLLGQPPKTMGFMVVVIIMIGSLLNLFHKALLALKHGIKGQDSFSLMVQATENNRRLILVVETSAVALLLIPLLLGVWGLGPYLVMLYVTWVYFVNKAIFDGTAEPEAGAVARHVQSAGSYQR